MTNESSNIDSFKNLFPADNKLYEIIEKLGNDFNKLNNEFINLLEENQDIKQKYNNLSEKNQEILNENFILKKKLQESDKKFENFQQYVLNFEKKKKIDGIQQLEIISQNLENNLEILKLNEINENDIKILKEKNKLYANKISQYQYNIDKSTTFPLIDDKNRNVQLVKDIENSSSSFMEETPRKMVNQPKRNKAKKTIIRPRISK